MTIAEKLASLPDERLARKYAALQANDWAPSTYYDLIEQITMDDWFRLVKIEMRGRGLLREEKEMVRV